MSTIRAILIDPFDCNIMSVQLFAERGEFGQWTAKLSAMRERLQCDLISVVGVGRDRSGRPVDLICDDEGRLKPQWQENPDGTRTCLQRCFQLGPDLLIAGRALLLTRDEYGNSCGIEMSTTDAAVKDQWLPEDVDYRPPAPVVMSFDSLDEMLAHMERSRSGR